MNVIETNWCYNFATILCRNLHKEFEVLHLSGNLSNTIRMSISDEYATVRIPALRYDIRLYVKKGIIKYTDTGSYAQSVDNWGGFSKKHKGYVEKAILKSAVEWLNFMGKKGRLEWQ